MSALPLDGDALDRLDGRRYPDKWTGDDESMLLSQSRAALALEAERDALKAQVERLREALVECEEWFDQRADADAQGDPMRYVGNAEMTMLGRVRLALAERAPEVER